jgi:hypothetical protein
MEGAKKWAAIGTAVMVLAVGARIGMIWHERREAAKPVDLNDVAGKPKVTDDQLVFVAKKNQTSLKEARELNGKRIWVSAGGQIDAYPATSAHMDYAHPDSLLLGAQPLDVVNFIEQKAPKNAALRIPTGERQVIMLFHRGSDPSKLYGTPVGDYEDGNYKFYLDNIFFYDDPHTLYKHWPATTWAAIDRHEVMKGMSELQSQIALGQILTPSGNSWGNRTVEYYNDNHPVRVTYQDDKATGMVKK